VLIARYKTIEITAVPISSSASAATTWYGCKNSMLSLASSFCGCKRSCEVIRVTFSVEHSIYTRL
jgi:hypothetical protein